MGEYNFVEIFDGLKRYCDSHGWPRNRVLIAPINCRRELYSVLNLIDIDGCAPVLGELNGFQVWFAPIGQNASGPQCIIYGMHDGDHYIEYGPQTMDFHARYQHIGDMFVKRGDR